MATVKVQKKLYEVVAHDLIGKIASEQLRPGQFLDNEVEMAEHYEVSKTVAREAVKLLAAKGLVTIRHGKGSMVNPSDKWNSLDVDILIALSEAGRKKNLAFELLSLRRAVEGEAAALAAVNAGPEDILHMEKCIETMKSRRNDSVAYDKAHAGFHDCIIRASGNSMFRHIMEIVNKLRSRNVFNVAGRRVAKVDIESHERVLNMIRKKDSQGAHRAMVMILDVFKTNIHMAIEIASEKPWKGIKGRVVDEPEQSLGGGRSQQGLLTNAEQKAINKSS